MTIRKEVREVFITPDGKEFDSLESASSYMTIQNLAEYLQDHPDLYWHDIAPEDVIKALLENYDIMEKKDD